ncbi:MAG TPA: hypothetical protein VH915_00680 [Pedococcus sp.]
MADVDTWTGADDAFVREALASLRTDTDAVPLADPRFVRARGRARRRRTLATWGAGAAAAAVVAATVGYAALGRDGTAPVPPATTTSTAGPSPSSEGTLATASALPLDVEWRRVLGLAATPAVQAQPAYEGNLCQTLEPGDRAEAERVVADASSPDATFLGVQTRYAFPTEQQARAGALTLSKGIESCAAPVAPKERAPAGARLPQGVRVWSYTKDGETGWLGVAQAGRGATWLEVGAGTPAAKATTEAEMADLVALAKERLRRYAGRAEPKPSVTTPPPRAADQDMPVSGVQPLLPSSLFVAASQWASPALTKGQPSSAGPGAQEGSASIVQCETEEFQAGVGGRYGIVSVRAGSGDANYIGKQRVRLFEDVQAHELVQADLQRMDELVMNGCTDPAGNRTTAQRGPVKGTYLLTTKVTAEATGTMYQWVGVSGMQTEGGVSTVVFHGTDDGQGFTGTADEGFTELLRLMDLARQK